MKVINFINLNVLIFSTIFMGCGGNNNEDSPAPISNAPIPEKNEEPKLPVPKQKFNYEQELAKAPELIQQAMRENLPQYVHIDEIRKLEKKKGVLLSYKMNSIMKTIDANKGYNFITYLVDNKIVLEHVITWDKGTGIYDEALRLLPIHTIDQNVENSMFEVFTNTGKDTENLLTIQKIVENNRTMTMNVSEEDGIQHITNIASTLNNSNQTIANFDLQVDGPLYQKVMACFVDVITKN